MKNMTKAQTRDALLLVSAIIENVSSLQKNNRTSDEIIQLSEVVDNYLIREGLMTNDNISKGINDLRDKASEILAIGDTHQIVNSRDLMSLHNNAENIIDEIEGTHNHNETDDTQPSHDYIIEQAGEILDFTLA